MAARADPAAYVAFILAHRHEREEFFLHAPDSPVPATARASLPPLEYYPVDPSWRLTLPLVPYPRPERLELITNTGETRVVTREAWVGFSRDGASMKLNLYREIDQLEAARYWVPFIDSGAGRETYPAGRYVDAEPQGEGAVVLDFNLTYNPYCAYGWNYSCPITPRENRLAVAVRAGERGYHRN